MMSADGLGGAIPNTEKVAYDPNGVVMDTPRPQTAQERPMSLLDEEVMNINKSLSHLDARVDALVDRLDPVMRPEDPACTNMKDGGAIETRSKLLGEMEYINRRIQIILSVVGETIERLDL